MTQDNVEQKIEDKKQDWLVTAPNDDESFLRHLQAACYGNEQIARLLIHMLYLARYEAERQHQPKSCKVVKFTRKHDDILVELKNKLKFNISKKTLIRYFDLLNEWGYVGSKRYGREFTVCIETIQQAVNNPPALPEPKQYDRHPQKSCSTTTLQHSPSNEHEELLLLREKVEGLQLKFEHLQLNVVALQEFVDSLQHYNFQSASVEKPSQEGVSEGSLLKEKIDTVIGNLENKDNVVASHNALTFTLLTEEDFQDIDKQLAKQTPGLQALKQIEVMRNTPPSDTPLTPAGNHHADADTVPDHTASSEPPNRQKTGVVESQPVNIPTPSVEAPKTAIQTQEMPFSTQADVDTSNQATEQGKQASGVDPIATGTTNTQPAQNPLATKKPRGGKGKKAEKPVVDASPKITPVLTEEEKAYKERCAGIYNQIVKRRGHEFNTGDEVKAERTMIRDHLAMKFTDAQIDRIHRYLVEEDKYWKLPENRIRISALIIWKESNEISTLLRERREEEERKKKSASSQSAGVTPLTQRMRAMKEQYLGSSAIAQ